MCQPAATDAARTGWLAGPAAAGTGAARPVAAAAARAMAAAALLLALAAPSPMAAERGTFALSFAGVRAGTLAFEADESGGSYTARGAARPSRLIAAIFDGTVDTVAEGRVQANTYRPRIARERTREDGEVVEQTYRYANGVPSVTREPPRRRPPEFAAPPEAQRGTVDTTTAAYAILRDRPADLACALDIAIYDGRRRHRVQLNQRELTAYGMICRGRYSRIAGFSPDDLDGRRHWPLQMEYLRLDDGTLRVMRLSFPTSFGTARISRR